MANKHLYLNNRKNQQNSFNRKRGFGKQEEEEIKEEPTLKPFQITQLRNNYAAFNDSYAQRYSRRTIEFPHYIDLIEINFFPIFNFDLKKKFIQRYGLFPVSYKDFNRTVVFEIENSTLFNVFKLHLEFIISSSEPLAYSGEEYNLFANIFKFRFIDK